MMAPIPGLGVSLQTQDAKPVHWKGRRSLARTSTKKCVSILIKSASGVQLEMISPHQAREGLNVSNRLFKNASRWAVVGTRLMLVRLPSHSNMLE